jgi:hypothetical protein
MDEFIEFEVIDINKISNRVSAIKTLRELTALGLKDAKDATERPGVQRMKIDTHYLSTYPDVNFEVEKRIVLLKSLGGIRVVRHGVQKMLEDLRELAQQALVMEEDELANEILQLVLAEKLRRKM